MSPRSALAMGAIAITAGCGPSEPPKPRVADPSAAPLAAARPAVDPEREMRIRLDVNRLGDPAQSAAAEARLRAMGRDASPILADSLPRLTGTPRARAAALLGDSGDPAAVPALVQAMDAKTPEALEALRRLTGRDFGPNRRAWIYWWAEESSRLPAAEHRRIRDAFLKEPAAAQQQAAIAVLQKLQSQNYGAVQTGGDAGMPGRHITIDAPTQEEIGRKMAALPVLDAILSQPTGQTAIYIAPLTRQIGSPAFPLLENALLQGGASEETRLQAVQALGELAPDRAPPALIGALRDPSGPVRLQAIRSLGMTRDRSAVQALEPIAREEGAPGTAAGVSLLLLDPKRSPEPLLSRIDGAGPEVAEELWRWARGHYARCHDAGRMLLLSNMEDREFLGWLNKQGLYEQPTALSPCPVRLNADAWRAWWRTHRTCKERS